MEMADYPKLDMDSSCEAGGVVGLVLEENMAAQKISVLDHINGFQCTKEKSDSFVIDMESFSHGINKDINTNSRITFQRSISRKWSPRGGSGGGEKKINSNLSHLSVSDREAIVASASPRVGPSTPEKAAVVMVGTADHSISPQLHHQITVTTGNINATQEGRCVRRNSFKRSSPSWVLDPKRVLFFFATLSSMGTMLLIYLTLSIGKLNAIDNSLD